MSLTSIQVNVEAIVADWLPIHLNKTGGTDLVAREWTGTDWWSSTTDLDAKTGIDTDNSPHSPSGNVVVECRTPLSMKDTTFGFFTRYVDSTEADAMHWYWPGPATFGYD